MKICWDNLESFWLTENGNFRKGTTTYIYRESCEKCGEPYLAEKSRQSKFCSFSCAVSGKNNPFFGKTHTIEAKKRMSGHRSCIVGQLNHMYKGDRAGFTMYDTHKNILYLYESIRKQEDTGMLEVRCTYCNQWFTPTSNAVYDRLKAINGLNKGEGRLYCSENCRQACPTYRRRKYPKGFKHTTSREVSTYLRQMVFERDNWTCQICGKTIKEIQLHCHHMDPVAQNPMFQNDMDSCITLCKKCHKMVHSRKGCRYVDLQCKQPPVTKNPDYPRRHS